MDKQVIQQMQSAFDALSQKVPESTVELWFARDLMEPLGYARWENFQTAIQRAVESCDSSGHAASDHFRGVTKMIGVGKASHLAQLLKNANGQIRTVISSHHRKRTGGIQGGLESRGGAAQHLCLCQ